MGKVVWQITMSLDGSARKPIPPRRDLRFPVAR